MSENRPVLDAHIHYSLKYPPEELVRTMDLTGTDMANLVVVPSHTALSSVPDALSVKDRYPGRFYVFASLDVSVYYRYGGHVGEKMRDYAKDMLAAGADGLKIIEGKPNIHKEVPVPDWDAPQWDPFFAWAEEEGVPILWHVNDPETFWHPESAPSWAVEQGWCYDETFINNEEQYRQILCMLEKHPKLKVIFAHFFFMSAQPERLSGILDRFPNLMVDLTPGIEMYQNFSKDPEAALAFFRRYGDRIVYGTDIGARGVLSDHPVSLDESLARAKVVHSFLEEKGEIPMAGDDMFLVDHGGFTMVAPGIPEELLDGIFGGNFRRFVGAPPKPVDRRLVLKDCRRIRITLMIMGFIDKNLKKDTSCLEQVEKYFKQRRK